MSDLGTALVFWPAVAIMLVTGVSVFRTSSMARAGLLLLASLGIEGLVFLALAAEFLGVLQLLMMSGEMVIMVFFMVMFMADPGGLMGMDMTHDKRRSAAVAVAVAVLLALLAVLTDWPAQALTGETPDLEQIGFQVMGRSMLSFLFAGVTILFAMVGGIMLASHGGRLGLPAPGRTDRPEPEPDHGGHDAHGEAHA
jgi:NADH-quinone oxidoreductase subunit J